MAHIVTCVYCKQRFDRDKVPFVQVANRRYAHQECSEQENLRLFKEEADKIDLDTYIMGLFKLDYVTPRIRKQLNTYAEQYGYSYSGMKKALVYFYEIKGNSIEKANGGVGIIPYVYQDARNYYYALWEANQNNEGKVIADYIPKERIVKIPVPKRQLRKRKLFTFLDEEETHGQ